MGPFACSCESIKLALVGLSRSSPMIKALDWLCFPVFVQVICRNFTEAHILYIGGYSKEAVNRYKNKTKQISMYIFLIKKLYWPQHDEKWVKKKS